MTVSDIPNHVSELRQNFDAGFARSIRVRLEQLAGIEALTRENQTAIIEAIKQDLGRCATESYNAELSVVLAEAKEAERSLSAWMRPRRVSTPLPLQPGHAEIQPTPKGVVLIIGPWNYPFQLILLPLIAAIAAGNTVMIKPSELAPHTSALIAKLLPAYVSTDMVRLVQGGPEVAGALLEERFDHIFYTGGPRVAKIVARAAAEYLTPITLELGGKSPCIVDENVDLNLTARRIVWGKFLNAGQTCIAPDYVLVHEQQRVPLQHALLEAIQSFYGDDPGVSPDYARIINEAHFDRLVGMLDTGRLVAGGKSDRDSRYLAPTIITDVPEGAPLLQEEIFGPILPIVPVPSMNAAIDYVNRRPIPLALYAFSKSKEVTDDILQRTRSGGATVNHTLLHFSVPELPFGGLGPSGQGAYHGEHGFLTFSHARGVLKKPQIIDPQLMYPPYTETKQKILSWVLG